MNSSGSSEAMTPINVLIFEPYPFNSEGGNQRTLSYILKFTDQARFKYSVVSPAETEYIRRLRQRGVDCIVAEPPERLLRYGGRSLNEGVGKRLLTAIGLLWYNMRVARIIRERGIDVVYCNCIRAVLFAGLAARLTRRPILWYIKGELHNPILDAIGFFLADRILFFCKTNMRDRYPRLVERYRRKIGILKIGMDVRSVQEPGKRVREQLQRELGIDAHRTNIIFLGQLYPPKGVHFLIEALGMIVKQWENCVLYMVGDHVIEEYREYKNQIDALVNKCGLQKNVVFTGYRRDAMAILSMMDILVHPSLSEGFGRAVLEAMAYGKAVVASRVGGLREIIRDGENGFLVEPGDPVALAERMRRLIADRDLRQRIGAEAKRTVEVDYRIEDKMHELERIWVELGSAKDRKPANTVSVSYRD